MKIEKVCSYCHTDIRFIRSTFFTAHQPFFSTIHPEDEEAVAWELLVETDALAEVDNSEVEAGSAAELESVLETEAEALTLTEGSSIEADAVVWFKETNQIYSLDFFSYYYKHQFNTNL